MSAPAESSPFLGAGMIAAAGGFSLLFSEMPGSAYSFGEVLGQLMGSGILALPVYLVWRFALPQGKSASPVRAWNVFAGMLAGVWFLLYVVVRNLVA